MDMKIVGVFQDCGYTNTEVVDTLQVVDTTGFVRKIPYPGINSRQLKLLFATCVILFNLAVNLVQGVVAKLVCSSILVLTLNRLIHPLTHSA
jgi:hypothetical protein